MPIRLRTVLCAVIVLLTVPSARADEGWAIERLDFRLDIQPDSSIEAREAIDVDFRGLAHHGIYRDVATLQTYDGTSNRQYDIVLRSVTDADDRPHQVQTTTEGSARRFRIGDPGRMISGKETYRLAYRLAGALNAFADHDELYWNATGVWPVRVDCFQGQSGSTERCDAQLDSSEAIFTATRPLAAGEQMTIVAGLRKGAVAAPAPLLVARPRDIFGFFDSTPTLLALMFGGFVLVF